MSTESNVSREKIFQACLADLEHMAFKETRMGSKPEELLAFAINVDDPSWIAIVGVLMPNVTEEDWQAHRDRGETPIANGIGMAEGLIGFLAETFPAIAPTLLDMLPHDKAVRTIIMSDGGASVYYVQPFPHYRDG